MLSANIARSHALFPCTRQTLARLSLRPSEQTLPRAVLFCSFKTQTPTSTSNSASMEASAASEAPSSSEVVLQYIVLRRDLWADMAWPLGSVVAQGCHAATAALWLSRESPITVEYCSSENLDHMHKVVLEVKGEAQLRNLSQKLSEAGILHKLWVEQPEDFPTCIATAPYPKAQVQPFVKKFKLCKGA